jgi:hypothetical protein
MRETTLQIIQFLTAVDEYESLVAYNETNKQRSRKSTDVKAMAIFSTYLNIKEKNNISPSLPPNTTYLLQKVFAYENDVISINRECNHYKQLIATRDHVFASAKESAREFAKVDCFFKFSATKEFETLIPMIFTSMKAK